MATGVSRANIKIEGLDKVLKDLSSVHPIYAEPWRKALTKATAAGKASVVTRAPRMSGTLAGSTTSKLDARPIPTYGIVSASASNNGVRYPFALNAGKGKKTAGGANSIPHYRRGPRQGRPTRRWFSGALASIRPLINALLNGAAREIESHWGR